MASFEVVKSLSKIKKCKKIVGICLLLLLTQFIVLNLVHGQVSYATYGCRVNLDSEGNGSVFVVYAVFAEDQPLQISSEEILFPVYNSTAILEDTMDIRDIYGKELTWSWEDSKDFLKVLIGPVDIPAGGKYEVRTSYDQNHLSRIVNETHYFAYEWDFSRIMNSPYTIRQYTIEVQVPADTLFDSYPIDYIGVSPISLNNYIIQSGSTVGLTYSFSVSDVTMNIYYRHEYGLPFFIIATSAMFILVLAIAILIVSRRRKGIGF